MLDTLTREQFAEHQGETFRLETGGSATFDLTLAEATPLGGAARGGEREPFSLTFRGPAEPVLPQAIYPVEHPKLGKLEIFLVPIGPDPKEKGMRYEAVFT